MPSSEDVRRETEAALSARRELGPEYDDQIADGLARRVEQAVRYQTQETGRREAWYAKKQRDEERRSRGQRLALAIVSIGAGIPITAISGGMVDPGLLGVGASWAGIVGINAIFARSSRRGSDEGQQDS